MTQIVSGNHLHFENYIGSRNMNSECTHYGSLKLDNERLKTTTTPDLSFSTCRKCGAFTFPPLAELGMVLHQLLMTDGTDTRQL